MLQKHLCIVGIDKHWIEKEVIKFFRKSFQQGPKEGAATKLNDNDDDIPLAGVIKKRGKTFGFL